MLYVESLLMPRPVFGPSEPPPVPTSTVSRREDLSQVQVSWGQVPLGVCLIWADQSGEEGEEKGFPELIAFLLRYPN